MSPELNYSERFTVSFEEYDGYWDTYWNNSRELFWYRLAWDILSKAGLTSYSTREEECLVYIRAITLNMIYHEFSAIAFDDICEHCDCDYYNNIQHLVSEIELGQLYGKIVLANNHYEDISDDCYLMARVLADHEWDRVFDALSKVLGDLRFFAGMYLTCAEPEECITEVEDEDGYTDEVCLLESYEQYCEIGRAHV